MLRLGPRLAWFLGFTAAFAALVAYVFWGTWSPDVVPVMPDTLTCYPATYLADTLRGFWETGRLIPDDLKVFVGGPWFWQELQYAFALYFAALGVVYYCRGRGLSRPASYGAALLLAFSGYWLTLYSAGHLGWFRWMTYGVFAFGLADRAVRRGRLRHWLMLGATVAWAGFNQQDLWFLFSVFTFVYFAWCCVRERKFPWKGMLVAGAVFVAVGLPNIVSTIEGPLKYRKEGVTKEDPTIRSGGTEAERRWEFVTNWSLPTDESLEFLVPRLNGDTSCPFVLSINGAKGVRPYTGALGRPMNAEKGNYRQHSLYVGWATILFALCGVAWLFVGKGKVKVPGRSDVAFFAVAALVFWTLSLGRYFAPAYRVVMAMPFGDVIRCPVKWHHLVELSLAFLAAIGIDAVLRLADAMHLRSRVAVAVVSLAVFFGACGLAANAHLYCAPVDMRTARNGNLSSQMAVLSRGDFANPQVAAMVRAGRIVSLANFLGNPDQFLVSVLNPYTRPPARPAPSLMTILLGCVSLLATLGVSAFCVRSSLGK